MKQESAYRWAGAASRAPARLSTWGAAFTLALGFSPQVRAQLLEAPKSTQSAREQAPQDLTGYWVSLVTEDWRFRMMVADPGDTESVPLNAEGLKVAKSWNPDQARADNANACKAFGAAGLMRIPGRLHISWQGDNVLKIQTDSGTQTRLFYFSKPLPRDESLSLQGYSVARWQGTGSRQPLGRSQKTKEGYLEVITDHLLPGYLRTNGVPYSSGTKLLEYYDGFREANGDVYLVITTVVTDATYLTQPFVTSSHFKQQPGNSGWDPTPCRADEPR